MRNPAEKLDPDTCVDFSTHGNLVTDKFRKGWEMAFGNPSEEEIRMWKAGLKEEVYGKAESFDSEEEMVKRITG